MSSRGIAARLASEHQRRWASAECQQRAAHQKEGARRWGGCVASIR